MIAYTIADASGAPVAVHRRIEGDDGKRFTWELPDGTTGLGGFPVADLPLYGVHRAERRSVIVCEGEKAAQALMDAGMTAVGTVTGAASSPSLKALSDLAGKVVYLWPDNDEAGSSHMAKVAAHLAPIAASVQWIEPPSEAPKGWDSADAMAEGGRELVESLVRGARTWADKLSAAPSVPSGRKQLTHLTARQLAEQTPEDVAWIARPWVARGAITELDGRPKAAGKTTFLAHLIRAALDGAPFLGQPTRRTPVVLLTEQGPTSLRATLGRAGLLERDDLHIVLWRDARGASWPAIAEGAAELCRSVGAELLVIDTLPQFAGLRGDSENDSGAALEAMEPLQAAASDGLGIVVSRHDRKGGGDVGESGRGSGAFAGAVDVVLALRRGDGESRPTIRHLHALSRFEETPDEVVVELTDDGFVILGSAVNFAVEEAKASVLGTLADDGLTVAELVSATGLKRTSVQAGLMELVAAGTVRREGIGKRNDPYRFSRSPGLLPEPITDAIGPAETFSETDRGLAMDLRPMVRTIFGDDLMDAEMAP